MADRNIIVSYRGLSQALRPKSSAGDEGLESPRTVVPPAVAARAAAEKVEPNDPAAREELLVRFSQAMTELRQAEAGGGLLQSPASRDAAMLQSFLEENPKGQTIEAEAGGEELTFATDDLGGWFLSVFNWIKKLNPRPQKRPTSTVPGDIPDNARVFVVADWGTGMYGAPVIRDTLLAEGVGKYDLLLHLGDVYYSGTKSEVKKRFLGVWPKAAGKMSRALNSNHEMYSGGEGYFDETLPKFDQPSNYFAMQNGKWLLIGMDTGYHEHDIDDEQARWIRDVVAAAGSRKLLLFSHHQLFSSFDNQGPKLSRQLHDLLANRRITAWYWGHVHQCLIHEPHDTYGFLARCIGHGGMPGARSSEVTSLEPAQPIKGSDSVWRPVPARDLIPGGIVLDGRNEFIKGQENKYGPNGYMTLEFKLDKLIERVHSPRGLELWKNEISA